ncbi:hypothetical protein FRC06_008350 [Ceratobasidium sp. 370]|nr:hypothetical protein FRC06_008350 [Ceratobasidium sp. 370]
MDAWRRTGHYPFNPNIFTEMDYAPSKITSTETDQSHLYSSVSPADGLLTCWLWGYLGGPTPVSQSENTPAPTLVTTVEDQIPIDPVLLADGHGALGDTTDHNATLLLTNTDRGEPHSVSAHDGDSVMIDQLEPNLPLSQPSSSELEQNHIPIQLPTTPPSQLLCSQFISSCQGLQLKDQVVQWDKEIKSLWQNVVQVTEYAQNAYPDLVLLKRQYEDLRHQLDARNTPKCTSVEAAAMSKIQKSGFLTRPEMREAFEKALREEEAKRVAEADKAARKEAKAKDIEGKRSLIIADQTYAFDGTFQSDKVKNLERLGDLAVCLGVLFVNSKHSEIFKT